MPPQHFDSESESEEVIASKKKPVVVDDDDDDGEQEEADEEFGEDEYVVEKIVDHRFEGKTLHFLVKWKGYEKKSDMTWEPEENCAGAKEAVEEYYKGIGGKPTYTKTSPAVSSKRGRQSTGTPATQPKKKQRNHSPTSKSDVKSEPAEEKWKPPAGSWEDEIAAIDTIEKTEKGLICYIQWANGKKSQHEVGTVYKKAPQRMLKFYEQHLVFKETSTTDSNYQEVDDD